MAKVETPLPERPNLSPWDVLVLMAMVIAFLFVLTIMINEKAVVPWINRHRSLLDLLALAEAAIFLVWIFVDGISSPLWRWLPPFCTFPKVVWVRWFVVLAMVCGTIAGVVAGRLSK